MQEKHFKFSSVRKVKVNILHRYLFCTISFINLHLFILIYCSPSIGEKTNEMIKIVLYALFNFMGKDLPSNLRFKHYAFARATRSVLVMEWKLDWSSGSLDWWFARSFCNKSQHTFDKKSSKQPTKSMLII